MKVRGGWGVGGGVALGEEVALSRSFVIKERPCLTSFRSNEARREMFLCKVLSPFLSLPLNSAAQTLKMANLTFFPISELLLLPRFKV